MYAERRGQAMAYLVGLFKIRNVRMKDVSQLAFLPVLDSVNGGRFHGVSGYILVCRRYKAQDMSIIDIVVVVP